MTEEFATGFFRGPRSHVKRILAFLSLDCNHYLPEGSIVRVDITEKECIPKNLFEEAFRIWIRGTDQRVNHKSKEYYV